MNIEDKIENIKQKKLIMDKLFLELIQSKSFKELVRQYIDCKTEDIPEFIFAGIGKNWYICQKVVKTFISMGLKAQALDCGHALHGDLGMLAGEKDKVLFFISRSGTTKELVEVANIVRMLVDTNVYPNVKIISVFLNASKPNQELYDVNLIPDDSTILSQICEFDDRNLVPSFSIDITQLALDLFGIMIYEAHQDLVDKYVYNHLGGANGAKLNSQKILSKLF